MSSPPAFIQGAYCAQCALLGHFQSACPLYTSRPPKEAVPCLKPAPATFVRTLRDDPQTFRSFLQAHGRDVRMKKDATPEERRKVEERMKREAEKYIKEHSLAIRWEPTSWTHEKKSAPKKNAKQTASNKATPSDKASNKAQQTAPPSTENTPNS